MAGKRLYWKEKDGRFWARLAVPKALQAILGKTELIEPLGGDRKVAERNHAAAVARLQDQIDQAREQLFGQEAKAANRVGLQSITAADLNRVASEHYAQVLREQEERRASMPTQGEIEAELQLLWQRIDAGHANPSHNPYGIFNVYADYELKSGARHMDKNLRRRRLAAFKSMLANGETRFVDPNVSRYVAERRLTARPGSSDWFNIGQAFARAEIEALQRTLEIDDGNFGGLPSDPIVMSPSAAEAIVSPEPIKILLADYVASKQAVGKHRDGGAIWDPVIASLIAFVGHDDARRITKRNLLDWRDSLLASGKAAKTVSDKYLAAVRAVFRWAEQNDRLPTNEAAMVHQEVQRKVRTREVGYTTAEAQRILEASLFYVPARASNPSNRESDHITAAKRWVPLLCAFTGARVTEMTQLRREDVRPEGDRWVLRITPDAGSVKTGQYRDVPLHRQVEALGFIEFVKSAKAGPLFHRAKSQDKYLANARVSGGRLTEWLHSLNLVPDGVQPNHGWRHRFKTQGLELGVSDRVLDGIQGHAGKNASSGYGDVSITAMLSVIDALPEYDLGEAAVLPVGGPRAED